MKLLSILHLPRLRALPAGRALRLVLRSSPSVVGSLARSRAAAVFVFASSFLILPSSFAAELPAPSSSLQAPSSVDHYVYLSFMPKPSELMEDAKANHLTILRIDEQADRVIVSYQYPDGHTATLGYAKLGSAGADNRVTARPSSVTRPLYSDERVIRDPEVVYVDRDYYPRYVYNDPWDGFWAPLTLGIGLGWATGGHWHGGGHYHGGYHGGWHRR